MVGSGAGVGDNRSKEAVGMMALHESLRNVCLNSDWTYSVFWTIRPRPRCRGGNGCKVGDDNGSLMLMWEDGFCRTADDLDGSGDDPVRKAFSKMSIQLYNYGEGLMGKVASDKCHKWVFKEPSECEPNSISNYWQSSFDAIPQEWTEQFASGIQTIAVIQAGHGLLQLGSCKIIAEDLHFVLRMRHMFESLAYQSGFYLSQLFSSARTTTPPPMPKQNPVRSLPGWAPQRPGQANLIPSPTAIRGGKDEPIHMFLPLMGATVGHPSPPPPPSTHLDGGNVDPELKWPNGLSFFTALTGRADESKLLFSDEPHHHPLTLGGPSSKEKLDHDHGECGTTGGVQKMDQSFKFKRGFTLPTARGASSPLDASNSYVPTAHSGGAVGNGGGGDAIYSDIMETFLE